MTSFGGFETCEFEEFVSEATPQANTLEEAASTQEILIQQLEGYLQRLKAAVCTDLTTIETQIPVPLDEFTELIDTPGTYVGAGLFSVRVNVLETGLEFAPYPVVQGADHGLLVGLADDDHLQYLLLAGRAGGQAAFGGTGATEALTLRGSTNADLGFLDIDSPVRMDVDWTVTTTTNVISWATTVPASGAAVAAFIRVEPTITIDSGLFIFGTVVDAGRYLQTVSPGFAVQTLFLGQPNLETMTAAVQPNQTFIYAAQPQMENNGAGALATPIANIIGMTFVPQMITRVAGDTLSATNITGVSVSPTFSTVAGTSIAFGTIRGLVLANPAVGLFQPGAGTETMTAYIGVDCAAIPFGGNVTKVVVRSALVAATNARFLQNNSTAASTFGTSVVHHSDNGVIQFGGALNASDVSLFWSSAGFLEMFFWSTLDFLQWTSPAANRFLIEANDFGVSEINYSEVSFAFDRFAFGQTGAIGNQVGLFVAPDRTAGIAGGWADFLLTQAGGLQLGVFAMSDVSAWVVNAISLDNSAYSIAELATFRVGGMTTSNPGGTVTERAALWVRGRHMQEGTIQYEPIVPAALAAGNNNNWAGLLTGSPSNNTRYWARISGNAVLSIITGIDATAVQDGDTFELTNVSANAIDFSHQDAASVAANRLISPTGANYTIGADETVLVRYDSTTARWRIGQGTGA